MRIFIVFVCLLLLQAPFARNVMAGSVFVYKKPKVDHVGKEATPLETFAMIKKDPVHMFLVDVRTRGEYQYIGQPQGAVLIPFQFIGTRFDGKGYEMLENAGFAKDVRTRFNPETDTLFLRCRSGTRAAIALNVLAKAG